MQFGGTKGRTLTLKAGDVAILSAGRGHQCLKASEDFLVVGAYAASGTYDECASLEGADHNSKSCTPAQGPYLRQGWSTDAGLAQIKSWALLKTKRTSICLDRFQRKSPTSAMPLQTHQETRQGPTPRLKRCARKSRRPCLRCSRPERPASQRRRRKSADEGCCGASGTGLTCRRARLFSRYQKSGPPLIVSGAAARGPRN